MNVKRLFLCSLVCFCTVFGACKSQATVVSENNNSNMTIVTTPTPENTNEVVDNTNVMTNKATDEKKSDKFSLSTPSDTFKSHYAALRENDEESLRKTLSSGMLKLYSSMFPGEKIVKMMRDMLKDQGETMDTPEIVSEKISGNNAVLKWKAGDGTVVDQPLVKEGDDWKMAMGK